MKSITNKLLRHLMARFAKGNVKLRQSLVPNAETIEAIKMARRGELVTVDSLKELLASLNEGD